MSHVEALTSTDAESDRSRTVSGVTHTRKSLPRAWERSRQNRAAMNCKDCISTRPQWLARMGTLLMLLTCSSGANAQFDGAMRVTSVYPDISIEAATHLRTAASYVADKNWAEAVNLYQKLIEKFG